MGPSVVVLGMMGRTPFAGVAWQVLHYLEGFRRIGADVWYVEDTGAWPYDPVRNEMTSDPSYTVGFIDRLLRWAGMEDRWCYVTADGTALGPAGARLDEVFGRADALVNLTGATVLKDAHLEVPVRIYLETDPVLPEVEVAQGKQFTIEMLDAHTHHFTFGENLGAEDCPVPVPRYRWRPTRQPIVPEWWAGTGNGAGDRYTTISSWEQTGKDVVWQGRTYYWSKHVEFERFLDAPRHVSRPLELALASRDEAVLSRLRDRGWHLTDGVALSTDIFPYRDYILRSRGEFTVAKDQYTTLRTGWFSDRSATYLLAGKPVVTQDTVFGKFIPTGRGLFAFSTMDDIAQAIEEIERDYQGHAQAAREIGEEYFGAERVVRRLASEAGLA